MVIFFLNHEITIYRLRKKGSNLRYGLSATFTSYRADIQPASQERTEFVQGRFGKTWQAFIDSSVDIKETDEVRVVGGTFNGRRFSVKGVSHWEGAGLLDHIELILVSQDG